MTTNADILTSRDNGVLRIEINRAQKRNALTLEMYERLNEALREAEEQEAVRVVLFCGQPDVFTAGNDLEDFLARPPVDEQSPTWRFLRAVSRATKPLVAAVNGSAVGIGVTLLLHCDLVYAGDNARFRLPFTSLGLVPEFASSYLLPMIAGYQRAAELLLLAEPFGPEKALQAGFVTRVVPAAETLAIAEQAAAKLAALPAKSVQVTKALLKGAHRALIETQLQAEAVHWRAMLGEPAAREAFAAFMEKRPPDFSQMR
ncbi:MAG TPA: enoyl-CoA hydratase [Usitatibacter sp.]|nr:enoyl-CoA hydratase [Usitatibacter sp.]